MKKCMHILLAICLVMMLTAASAETFDESSLPSLKEFYANYFDFGSALSSAELRNQDRLPFYYSAVCDHHARK